MLCNLKKLIGRSAEASDGEIGECIDFLFDDEKWVIRYAVVNTGNWMRRNEVILSAFSLASPKKALNSGNLGLKLTKQQVEDSPQADETAPVSRQFELELARYYSHPIYWAGEGTWGTEPYPMFTQPVPPEEYDRHAERLREIEQSPLRSMKEVCGYHIQATDESVGHVEDLIVEDDSWVVRYVIVDTRNWLPGRKLIISPSWIESFDWHERNARVRFDSKTIRSSPEFDADRALDRDYEELLHDYYAQPRYW